MPGVRIAQNTKLGAGGLKESEQVSQGSDYANEENWHTTQWHVHSRIRKRMVLNNILAAEASFEIEELQENEQLPFKRVVKKIVSSRQRVPEK